MTALSDNLTNRSTTQPGTTLLIGLLRTNKASAYFLNSVSYSLSPARHPFIAPLTCPRKGASQALLMNNLLMGDGNELEAEGFGLSL